MGMINFSRTFVVAVACCLAASTQIYANVYYVNSFGDVPSMTANQTDGRITLREAVMAANTNQPFGDAGAGSSTLTDSILFQLPKGVSSQVILLNDSLPIEGMTTILGPGISISGNRIEISGQDQHQVFRVRPDAFFRLHAVDLSHGNSLQGGLINAANSAGLELTDVEFSDGVARDGGAIYARNVAFALRRCTFRDNLATRSGGAFYVDYQGTWCENCTFTRNHAELGGGAMFFDPRSNRTAVSNIMSCTIVDNTTGLPGIASGQGAGIVYKDGFEEQFKLILLNCIVADNVQFHLNGTAEPSDLIAAPFISGGNFIGFADSLSRVIDGVNGNQVGTINQPLDPRLFPLGHNGAPTQNFFPRWNSPVVNAGDDQFVVGSSSLGITIEEDQRNVSRIRGSHVDVGSVER